MASRKWKECLTFHLWDTKFVNVFTFGKLPSSSLWQSRQTGTGNPIFKDIKRCSNNMQYAVQYLIVSGQWGIWNNAMCHYCHYLTVCELYSYLLRIFVCIKMRLNSVYSSSCWIIAYFSSHFTWTMQHMEQLWRTGAYGPW